jgi:hypothetical protein
MDVFTHTSFSGHWPVGVAAVVVAESEQQALEILNAALKSFGLPGDATTNGLKKVDTSSVQAVILNDGDY